jgi:hypothetical protein
MARPGPLKRRIISLIEEQIAASECELAAVIDLPGIPADLRAELVVRLIELKAKAESSIGKES